MWYSKNLNSPPVGLNDGCKKFIVYMKSSSCDRNSCSLQWSQMVERFNSRKSMTQSFSILSKYGWISSLHAAKTPLMELQTFRKRSRVFVYVWHNISAFESHFTNQKPLTATTWCVDIAAQDTGFECGVTTVPVCRVRFCSWACGCCAGCSSGPVLPGPS